MKSSEASERVIATRVSVCCLLAPVAIDGDCSVAASCASMPMIIMEHVSLSWVARTGRSAWHIQSGDATLLEVGGPLLVSAGRKTQATEAETLQSEPANRFQNDIWEMRGLVTAGRTFRTLNFAGPPTSGSTGQDPPPVGNPRSMCGAPALLPTRLASPRPRASRSRSLSVLAGLPDHERRALRHHGDITTLVGAQPIQLLGHLGQAGLQRLDLVGQLDDPLDASQIDTLVLRQPLHLSEQVDVALRVAGVAAGSCDAG